MDLLVGGYSCSQTQNISDPALLPDSIMIDEPQFLLAPLINFPNDDLSSTVDVPMGGCSYSIDFQPRSDSNTVTQHQFSFAPILQMHAPPKTDHPMLDDPTSVNRVISRNTHLLHAGGNTASLHKLDIQNMTTTDQVASKYQNTIRKRAPKAQIMTKRWKSAEGRIRELYVTQGKKVKDVQKIVNKEFDFNATEIQYKQIFEKMKVQRRADAQEREAIVLHTLYRKKILKKESYVRLRGYEISREKLMRWKKELRNLPEFIVPSQTLSSGISICSVSQPGSPRLIPTGFSQSGLTGSHSIRKDDDFENLISSILRLNIQAPKCVMNSKEVGAVFNEVQKLLNSKPETDLKYISDDSACWPYKYTQSSPTVTQDILEVRNKMNTDQQLVLKEAHNNLPLPEFLDQKLQLSKSRFNNRSVSWITDKGVRIDASFYSELAIPMSDSSSETFAEQVEVRTITKVAIVSSATKKPSYHVALSVNPALPITVTFEATIPNNSEVFRIVSGGNVGLLRQVLQQGTANLTDRDEEGRSLLNYAITALQPEMIKFLLDKKADPNAIEMNVSGFIGPIHMFWGFRSRNDRDARIATLLAGYGADFSIEACVSGDAWFSSGNLLVTSTTAAQFQNMIDYGGPFIYPNSLSRYSSQDKSFLDLLATVCTQIKFNYEIVDKAICLLRRGADINYQCPDTEDTLLHIVLLSRLFNKDENDGNDSERILLSVQAPLELLIAFIAADANIFACNGRGRNLSEVAWNSGQEKLLHRALMVCGIDTKEYYSFTCRECHQCFECPECSPKLPSKLTFEDFCNRRQRGILFNDVAIDEDERRWLHGDYVNVPFKYEWRLGWEYHNPHGPCFEIYYGSPYFRGKQKLFDDEDFSIDDDYSQLTDFDEESSEGAENS